MTLVQSTSGPDDQALLDLAKSGSEEAYRELIEVHRSELHAHCYRMLASVDDADDAVQDTLLRAWRGIARFEGRSSVRTWLFKIATNAALDLAKSRTKRELPIGLGAPSPYGTEWGARPMDVSWLEPYPNERYVSTSPMPTPEARYERRESFELAFVAALQLLPARQRATYLLREVMAYSAADVAELLDTSVAAVNSSLQRARTTIDSKIPASTQQAAQAALGEDGVRHLAGQYCDAIERGDVDSLMHLLTEDATWSMAPETLYFRGKRDIAAFMKDDVFPQRWRHIVVSANFQLAVAGYILDDDRGSYLASGLDVITLEGGHISDVTGFLSADVQGFEPSVVFPRFGLPLELPA
jgi:RNA polymerase sigma-70 factor (ECF subfamily)